MTFSISETNSTDTLSLVYVMSRIAQLSYHYMWPSFIHFDRFSEYVVEHEVKD